MTDSIERIDLLVQEIESRDDPELREKVRELLQGLLDVHGTALARLLEHVYEENGQAFIDRVAEDELVGSVLVLHDLHPLGRTARVAGALESVRPYLATHGGNVELVEVRDDGRVVLRLEGSCDGCPSSQLTLRHTIEEAVVAAAPDIRSIEIEDAPDEGAREQGDEFIPMSDLHWDDCPFPGHVEEAVPPVKTEP